MLAIVVYVESIASAIVKMSYFLILTLRTPSQKNCTEMLFSMFCESIPSALRYQFVLL